MPFLFKPIETIQGINYFRGFVQTTVFVVLTLMEQLATSLYASKTETYGGEFYIDHNPQDGVPLVADNREVCDYFEFKVYGELQQARVGRIFFITLELFYAVTTAINLIRFFVNEFRVMSGCWPKFMNALFILTITFSLISAALFSHLEHFLKNYTKYEILDSVGPNCFSKDRQNAIDHGRAQLDQYTTELFVALVFTILSNLFCIGACSLYTKITAEKEAAQKKDELVAAIILQLSPLFTSQNHAGRTNPSAMFSESPYVTIKMTSV